MTTPCGELSRALAALDSIPDACMSLLVWWRGPDGELIRPCTREEIADGLRSGTITPESMLTMAQFATMTADQVADLTAKARRRNMRAV